MSICEKCKENHECAWQNHEETICKEKPAFPMTNADRIRNMTDEELANILTTINFSKQHKHEEWLEWLKQEAE